MKRATIAGLGWAVLALLLCGCPNSPRTHFLGQWQGGLKPESASGKIPLAKYEMKGYLQLYGTRSSFKLHLEGPQQTIDCTGNWELKSSPERVVLKVDDVVIDDFGGEERRNPNLPYLDEDKVRETFEVPLSLRLTPNRKELHSLSLTIDQVTGPLEFVRQGGGT